MRRAGTELETVVAESRWILDRLQAQVWVKGADCRFRYANAAFRRSLGSGELAEVVGEHERSFFSRRESAEFRDSDRLALDAQRAVVVMETGTPRESGKLFETLKLPIAGTATKPAATLGIAWDISSWAGVRNQLDASFALSSATDEGGLSGQRIPTWLLDAVRRLTEDDGGRVPAARIATALGIHPDSLGRTFRRRFGIRLAAYRRSLRAASAFDRIVQTQTPLVDIALDSGFADQSHMTREVRSAYGIAPGALRALAARRSNPV